MDEQAGAISTLVRPRMATVPATPADLRLIALNYGLLLMIAKVDGDDLTHAIEQARSLNVLADRMEDARVATGG